MSLTSVYTPAASPCMLQWGTMVISTMRVLPRAFMKCENEVRSPRNAASRYGWMEANVSATDKICYPRRQQIIRLDAEPVVENLVDEAESQMPVDVGNQRRHIVGHHAQAVFAFAQHGVGFVAVGHEVVEIGSELADFVVAHDRHRA